VLRTQYEKELAQSHITTQTKFNYAWGLVKSPVREHQVEGVKLLAGNVPRICSFLRVRSRTLAQIYTAKNPREDESACTIWHWGITRWATLMRRRASIVGPIFLGCSWSLRHHVTARLLEREPANLQALSLDGLIDTSVKRGTLLAFSLQRAKLTDHSQRDTLAWPSPAVRRRSAPFSLQV
jgi:hypothetical protein